MQTCIEKQAPAISVSLLNDLLEEGPQVQDYKFLNDLFNDAYTKDAQIFLSAFEDFRKNAAVFTTPASIAGFCYLQPYGYAGDFQLIDRLYTNYRGPGKVIQRWDDFAQSQPAAQAVRNRKAYFINLLQTCHPDKVLNIASGPCRDIKEYFDNNPDADTLIDCVDQDGRAIQYAQHLLQHNASVTFIQQNILLYRNTSTYQLVWSAGLFDYFTDRVFVRVLRKLLSCVEPGGELVIGNFADDNPNRAFMEGGMNWFLHHRSPEQLIDLAIEAGAAAWKPVVNKEPEGINLFLHLRCPVLA
jgi:extracellular factor (EF) 3-hydroxypalmitic acid methyl ester biosynthesis protein